MSVPWGNKVVLVTFMHAEAIVMQVKGSTPIPSVNSLENMQQLLALLLEWVTHTEESSSQTCLFSFGHLVYTISFRRWVGTRNIEMRLWAEAVRKGIFAQNSNSLSNPILLVTAGKHNKKNSDIRSIFVSPWGLLYLVLSSVHCNHKMAFSIPVKSTWTPIKVTLQ